MLLSCSVNDNSTQLPKFTSNHKQVKFISFVPARIQEKLKVQFILEDTASLFPTQPSAVSNGFEITSFHTLLMFVTHITLQTNVSKSFPSCLLIISAFPNGFQIVSSSCNYCTLSFVLAITVVKPVEHFLKSLINLFGFQFCVSRTLIFLSFAFSLLLQIQFPILKIVNFAHR